MGHKLSHRQTLDSMAAANSTEPKMEVQRLNQALYFNQSLFLVDSEVLRNRHLRIAAKRRETNYFTLNVKKIN